MKLKNYNVQIDAEAEHLTHEQTAEKIVKKIKLFFAVLANNLASTQCTWWKKNSIKNE